MTEPIEIVIAKMEASMENLMKNTIAQFEQMSLEIRELKRAIREMAELQRVHPVECDKKFVTKESLPYILKDIHEKMHTEEITKTNEKLRLGEYIYRIVMVLGMAGIVISQVIK